MEKRGLEQHGDEFAFSGLIKNVGLLAFQSLAVAGIQFVLDLNEFIFADNNDLSKIEIIFTDVDTLLKANLYFIYFGIAIMSGIMFIRNKNTGWGLLLLGEIMVCIKLILPFSYLFISFILLIFAVSCDVYALSWFRKQKSIAI